MKKYTIIIRKKDIDKEIAVWVDDEISVLLEQVDSKTRNTYLALEHQTYLNNLRETRRHSSMEVYLANGMQFQADEMTAEERVIKAETHLALCYALSTLKKKHLWLLEEIYIKGRQQQEIAAELGISKQAFSGRMSIIYRNLKNIIENFSVLTRKSRI